MTQLSNNTKLNIGMASTICALFLAYPNLACIPWDLERCIAQEHRGIYLAFHAFRLLYFATLMAGLAGWNTLKWKVHPRWRRWMISGVVSALCYAGFAYLSQSLCPYGIHDDLTGTLLWQFAIACPLGMFIAHIILIQNERQAMATEVERLRAENLQSHCNALTNQINPHFFFNSLSGIASLVRQGEKENTLNYIDELSDVFRYTLQSGHKGMVTLGEEMDFLEAFLYVVETRYSGKLKFNIEVDIVSYENYTLPVLSLLPLVENVIVHNRIDSAHPMTVDISINASDELVVSNPIHPKQTPPATNGTALHNLENRFTLMTGRTIRIQNDGTTFTVYLPLKQLNA
ncbi:MAG: histidine kinase [Bacteroidaceae bacterium]|nr:histidine kinase [Bacteroidaceae bacterium]